MILVAMMMLQAAGGAGLLSSPLFLILPMVLIMYFLVFRPQQQQRKRIQEMLAALKNGDKVVTNGGIYGTINGIDGDTVILKVAEQVKIRVARSAIAQVEATDDAK